MSTKMTTSYNRSVRWQKSVGTFDRNQRIKELRFQGFTFDSISKRYNISRQRAEQIVHNPFSNHPQAHQDAHRGILKKFYDLVYSVKKFLTREI